MLARRRHRRRNTLRRVLCAMLWLLGHSKEPLRIRFRNQRRDRTDKKYWIATGIRALNCKLSWLNSEEISVRRTFSQLEIPRLPTQFYLNHSYYKNSSYLQLRTIRSKNARFYHQKAYLHYTFYFAIYITAIFLS